MQFLISRGKSAAYYFGLEQYLAHDYCAADSVLLLWSCTPTIMCGRYQNVLAEVKWGALQEVEVVRRKSGGGTIYTDLGTLQFSVIEPQIQADQELELKPYILPVVDFLCSKGVPASLSGRNDIMLENYKISGHAQYRENGYVIHHGSILLAADLGALGNLLTPSKLKLNSKGIKSVVSRVCNIVDCIPEKADYFRDFSAVTTDFINFWQRQLASERTQDDAVSKQSELVEVVLPKEAEAKIAGYAEEYKIDLHSKHLDGLVDVEKSTSSANADWNYNPPFTITLSFDLSVGKADLMLSINKQKIIDAELYGDFLVPIKREEFIDGIKDLCGVEQVSSYLNQQKVFSTKDTEKIKQAIFKVF